MKGIVKLPNHKAEITDIKVKDIQDILEGYMEIIPMQENIIMLVNDRGVCDHLMPNIKMTDYDILGKIIFLEVSSDNEHFEPLTRESIKAVLDFCKKNHIETINEWGIKWFIVKMEL